MSWAIWTAVDLVDIMPSHHCMAVWNSKGSRCKLRRGGGITESQAAAWGDEADKRRALSDNDELSNNFLK